MLSMKKIFKKSLGIKFMGVMLGMMLAVPAFASIAVSPTRLEINANKVRGNYYTTAIDVRGDSSHPVRFKAYTGYFKLNNQGELLIVNDNNNDVNNISKKIRFVPSEFTVAPGKVQKLRVNITGLANLPEGESRAILYIEDVNTKEVNLPTGREGIGAQLIVKTRMGIPIYVDKGKFTKRASIDEFNLMPKKDGYYTDMKVSSTGTSKIRYTLKAQVIDGKKLVDEFNLVGSVVPAGGTNIDRQKIDTSNVKEAGNYTLRLILSYDDEKGKRQNIVKETNISIVGKM